MSTPQLHLWLVAGAQVDLPERNIFAGLARRGVAVTFVHSPGVRPTTLKFVRDAGMECVPIPFRNRIDLRATRRLRDELSRRPCDVIYAPQNKPLACVLRATRHFPHVKVVGYRGTMGHLAWWSPASWITYLHPRLAGIVAVSDAVRRYLVEDLRLPAEKVVRIYKGHDPDWYGGDLPDPPLPPPPERTLTLCFAGRIRPGKSVCHLLDAMDAIPRERAIRLLLVGDVADKAVERRLAAPDRDPRVIPLGFRRDATAIIGQSDIFLMPTVEREGLARAVIEAMSQRIPCVVSDVGGLPELVVDGNTGLVVPPRDGRAIADAVLRLADAPELRRQMGEAARARIESTFHYQASINAFLDFFLSLVDNGGKGKTSP